MQTPKPAAPQPPIPAAIAEQAVDWLLTLQEETPLSQQTLQAWQQWQAADPEHARAWQRIEAINGHLQQLCGTPEQDASAATHSARAALLQQGKKSSRRQAFKALAVLLLTGSGAWVLQQTAPVQRLTAQVRLPRGERLQQTLEDGSRITVAGQSALNLDYSASQRRIELLQGQIYVETGHQTGDARPFFIDTPYGRATALGTRYSVRLLEASGTRHTTKAGALVTVHEGSVQLRPINAPINHPGLILQAGEKAMLWQEETGNAEPANTQQDAWVQGSLVAQSMRLADFLAELAPHAPYLLECAPEIANLTISGSYPLGNIDQVLESIAKLLNLQIEIRQRLLGSKRVRLQARNT